MMTKNEPKRIDAALAFLADEGRFWPFFAVVLGSISLLKGLRLPNLWAATQALMDYDQGFVKRGLFGATLGHWFGLQHYAHFVGVSFALLLLLAVMLVLLTRRMVAHSTAHAILCAVFFSSFTVTYLAHLIGYLDIPLAILTIAIILIRDTRLRLAAALPLCVAALLLHELFLVIFLPAVLLTFVIDALDATPAARRRCLAMGGVLLVVCVALTVKLALKRPMSAGQIAALQSAIVHRADFPVRKDFFLVLTLSSGANMLQMFRDYFRNTQYLRQMAASLLIMLPTVLLLLAGIKISLARFAAHRLRRLLTAAVVLAALSPLAMHLIGWDYGRFNALTGLTCLLVLAVVSPRQTPIVLPAWYRNAALLAIALSLVSGDGLMDYAKPNPYPYLEKSQSLVKRILHKDWTPPAVPTVSP